MSYSELFVSSTPVFGGIQRTFEDANFVIMGVPLDLTGTYRCGTRFAPLAIRQASLNIETYSFRTGIDVEDIKIQDFGDLEIVGDMNENLRRLELVMRDLLVTKKILGVIGGEHTLTLGALRSFDAPIAVVSFDAHLDLRNKYMDLDTSHATFMRRVKEQINPIKLIEIGTRSVSKEELEYAEKSDIQFITVGRIREDGVPKTLKNVEKLLVDCKKIYLTIDMDVLDPAFAPAVQNPEPDGLSMSVFLSLLEKVCALPIVAFDLVEVTPPYDRGITAIHAAKVIYEVLCHIEHAQN